VSRLCICSTSIYVQKKASCSWTYQRTKGRTEVSHGAAPGERESPPHGSEPFPHQGVKAETVGSPGGGRDTDAFGLQGLGFKSQGFEFGTQDVGCRAKG